MTAPHRRAYDQARAEQHQILDNGLAFQVRRAGMRVNTSAG